jgi:hypothetical protein
MVSDINLLTYFMFMTATRWSKMKSCERKRTRKLKKRVDFTPFNFSDSLYSSYVRALTS